MVSRFMEGSQSIGIVINEQYRDGSPDQRYSTAVTIANRDTGSFIHYATLYF